MTGPATSDPTGDALTDRLRRGLREAAAALPADVVTGPAAFPLAELPSPAIPAGGAGTTGARVVVRRGWHRRSPTGRALRSAVDRRAVALVAATTVIAGSLGFAARWATEPQEARAGGGDAVTAGADAVLGPVGDELAFDPSGDTTGLGPAEDVTGRAQVVGPQVLTFDQSGSATGRRSLAPFDRVDAIASDTMGGWVACGAGLDEAVWYPAQAVPVVLDDVAVDCDRGGLSVVGTLDGRALVYRDPTRPGSPIAARALDLHAPGDAAADVPLAGLRTTGWGAWSADVGALVADTPEGLVLWSLEGARRPLDIVPGGEVTALRTAFDLRSIEGPLTTMVAAVVAGPDGPRGDGARVVLWDTASGHEVFTEAVPGPADAAALSYDGRRLAFGGAGAGRAPVTVVDLRTGARHTYGVGVDAELVP